MYQMATLKLSVNKLAFIVMVTGEKTEEYREESKWILSRLKKDYDFIQITNGFGSDRPVFVAEYLGYSIVSDVDKVYSNGLSVKGNKVVIRFGKIIDKRNV